MIPYLLPLILLMYGEFSKDMDSRFIARVLFYTYTLSQLIPISLTDPSHVLIGSWVIFTSGLGYCVIWCRNIVSRLCFLLASLTWTLNTWSLYLNDYTILLAIPYYADYSHFIVRESILAGLAYFEIGYTRNKDADWRLAGYVFWIMCVEAVIL